MRSCSLQRAQPTTSWIGALQVAVVLAGAASVVMGSGQRRVSMADSVRHGGVGFERSSVTTLFNHTIVAARDKQASTLGSRPRHRALGRPTGKAAPAVQHQPRGRGVYLCDPSGYYLEAITQPYGSDTAA